MNRPHLTPAEIADVLASPATDARRAHAAECVRCRLLLERYQAFLAPPAHVPPRELADAEAELAHFLDERIGGAPVPAPRSPARRVREANAFARWLRAFAQRPAIAVAALAVIGAGAAWIAAERGGPAPERTRVLRGPAASGAWRVAPPLALPDGGLALHWSAVAGADHYELRCFTPELRALGAAASTAETTFTMDPGVLAGVLRGDTLLVTISALSGEALLARSAPLPAVLARTGSAVR